jgi:nitrite reductase/ring-hydroxylating ferredoxin subunit
MPQSSNRIPCLNEDDVARVELPLEQAYTLPADAYTSNEIYRQEVEQIFRRSWLPVARTDQLPEPGCYLTMELFGQPIMVVHGSDGEFRVMPNVCLHRASPILEGSGKRHLFTCPYHAWSYDTQGQLMAAPLMEEATGFSEKDCRLTQIRSEIWEGFIFANFDPDAEPLAPQIEGFTQYFEKFKLADLVVVDTLEYDSRWNWKVLVENFMEAYHHIAVHSETFEPVYHARDSRIPDNTGPWSILHMPSVAEAPDSGLPAVDGLEDWQARDLFANAVFPFFLLGIQGNGGAWYQLLPGGPDRLLLKIHVLVPRSTTALEGFDEMARELSEAIAYIHQEDIGVNDKVWAGLNAPLTEQGRLSPFEKSIWQMNQWWLQQMSAKP